MSKSPRWLRALLSSVRPGRPIRNPSVTRASRPRGLGLEPLEDRTNPSSFSNTAAIAIPGSGTSGPAGLYPSDITVSGVATGAHVSVSFNTLHHQKDTN